MAKFTFNMPDIGEGIAEAEIVAVAQAGRRYDRLKTRNSPT